jgi:hypothetical protein
MTETKRSLRSGRGARRTGIIAGGTDTVRPGGQHGPAQAVVRPPSGGCCRCRPWPRNTSFALATPEKQQATPWTWCHGVSSACTGRCAHADERSSRSWVGRRGSGRRSCLMTAHQDHASSRSEAPIMRMSVILILIRNARHFAITPRSDRSKAINVVGSLEATDLGSPCVSRSGHARTRQSHAMSMFRPDRPPGGPKSKRAFRRERVVRQTTLSRRSGTKGACR